MALDDIRAEIERLTLGPDDVALVRIASDTLTTEEAQELCSSLAGLMGRPIVVMPSSMTVEAVSLEEIAALLETFRTEIAISRENGGGGNRTRVTCPAESAICSDISPDAAGGDDPRPFVTRRDRNASARGAT